MNLPIIFKFLKSLAKNNNREWFEKHKSEFIETKNEFEAVVASLLQGVVHFDPALSGLDPKNSRSGFIAMSVSAKTSAPIKPIWEQPFHPVVN